MAAHLAARFEELKFLDVTRLCRNQGAASAELHFKTASREILLNDVRRPDANEKTAFLNGWSCQERGTALLRSGTAGAMTTEKNVP